MWKISKLKSEARRGLSEFGYWMPFLVSFIYGILYSGFSGGSSGAVAGRTAVGTSSVSYQINTDTLYQLPEEYSAFIEKAQEFWTEFIANPIAVIMTSVILLCTIGIALILSFGWSAFIGNPLTVGLSRYYMEHRAFPTKFSRLFYSFRSGRYLNIVKIMFLMQIKTFFWSLLFIIPGIVKSYEYRMIPYILAENPQITTERAFQLSKQMTKGEKWHMFWLDLSFIGWEILAVLCCCIGGYFLAPYIIATNAELYEVMREKAHGIGFSDFTELPGFFPEQV